MKMGYGLACTFATVGHEAEARAVQTFVSCNDLCGGKKVRGRIGTGVKPHHRTDMGPGNEKDMDRGLGVNVFKRQHMLVFIDFSCGDLPIRYGAENALIHPENHPS